jgi:DNA-binding IclR family transcriptional regulator
MATQISAHQIRIFDFVSTADCWVTSGEIAERAAVSQRTARALARKLVRLGVFQQAAVFPGHRYRLAVQPARDHLERIKAARQALNIPETRR